jgi:hypothetical protein
MFGRGKWKPARATIVSHRETRRSSQGQAARYSFVADVTAPGREPFRTEMQMPHEFGGNFLPPAPGFTVDVLWNPRDDKVKFDMDDPTVNLGAAHRGRHDQRRDHDADLAQPPGTPPVHGADAYERTAAEFGDESPGAS